MSDDRGRVNSRWFVAFSFLLLAVHEAHELAHAVAGRLICGEWPIRDFNAWRFAGECASWWPTAAGPLFSYLLMLIGGLMTYRSTTYRLAGIAIVFAANPFARIFTAVMGGGDEMVVAQGVLSLSKRTPTLQLAVLLVVSAICGAALYTAWWGLRGHARRAAWFIVATVWPMVLTGLALFVVGNRLLRAGLLADPSITGAPLLVVLVSAAAVAGSLLTRRWFSATQPVMRNT